MLDPPGPLHRIWLKTKLIAVDGDVKDGAGWAHCRAAWLTLGVMFVCVNVCACRFDRDLSVWGWVGGGVGGSERKHHRGLPQTRHLVRVACLFLLCLSWGGGGGGPLGRPAASS